MAGYMCNCCADDATFDSSSAYTFIRITKELEKTTKLWFCCHGFFKTVINEHL